MMMMMMLMMEKMMDLVHAELYWEPHLGMMMGSKLVQLMGAQMD
jgi:hypothetical protein